MGITRGLIRVGIALPVLRGIATRLWGGHCEVCGREDAKENSQSDDRLHDTFSTAEEGANGTGPPRAVRGWGRRTDVN